MAGECRLSDPASLQISPLFRSYLDDEAISKASENVARYRIAFIDVLSPVEGWLMTVQSLLVWEKPSRSAVMLACVHALFWMMSSASTRIVSIVAWGCLTVYCIYLWRTQVWPTIRVPPKYNDDESWTPVHPNLLSLPELGQRLAEGLVLLKLYFKAITNLRRRRKSSFLVLIWMVCALIGMLGHYVSGVTLSYFVVMSILLWPALTYHQLLHKWYMRIEPLMMRLHYNLKLRKTTDRSTIRQKVSNDAAADTVETDSECGDPYQYPPPADPRMQAALAKVITDSEDESVSVHEKNGDYSLGCNSDTENDDPLQDEHLESTVSATLSLAPNVFEMPDFEHFCDESNTFMLETEFMPSVEECDISRRHLREHPCLQSGVDTESLPYDRLPAIRHPLTSYSAPVQEAALTASTILSNILSSSMLPKGWMHAPLAQDQQLLTHPMDRLGDAGADSDSDFEILDKAELAHHTDN